MPGAVFKGHNRNGVASLDARHAPSPTPSLAASSPSTSATSVLPIAHWRYDIVPAEGGGCQVIERTWDRRPGWFSKTAWVGTGVRDRDAANAEHIKLTLQRLKEKAEAG